MRYLAFSIILAFTPLQVASFEVEDQLVLGAENRTNVLRIISTTDAKLFRPVLEEFMKIQTDISVEYIVTSSTELVNALSNEGAQFDIAISSAMDLQTKLANDRQTKSFTPDAQLPDWAKWRQDVFAFTQEPAAIVLSKSLFHEFELPQNREDLLALLRSNPNHFRGRIGTYDLRHSGLGYLFATQDSRMSEIYWRLTEVMGALDAKLYRNSAKMIDDLANGNLAVAYNVLGSYALSRIDRDNLHVIFPSDFTTVMMRTAIIPATAKNTDGAGKLINYLLFSAWKKQNKPSVLGALFIDLDGKEESARRIRLGPGLLVFLDELKKKSFLSAWENSILQK